MPHKLVVQCDVPEIFALLLLSSFGLRLFLFLARGLCLLDWNKVLIVGSNLLSFTAKVVKHWNVGIPGDN